MSSTTVGIRELKARLSYYLQQVKAGALWSSPNTIAQLGKIVPANLAIDERLQALADAGLVAWSGKSLLAIEPVAKTRGPRTVADLLVEDRE